MPKLSNSLPKYRKHRASGQALVSIAGRDHYLGPHGTKASKLQYDRLISEWLLSGRSSSFGVAACQLTLAELLLQFLDYAADYYITGSRSEYHHFVRVSRPLKSLYGDTVAVDFGPLELKVIRQRLIDDGCARKHVNSLIRRVKFIFRWWAAEGLIPPEVPQALSMVAGLKRGRTEARESAPIEPVDDAIVEATSEHLFETIRDMVRLQRLTAARPSEICILRPCDLDRTGEVWTYRPSHHKTEHHGRERIIQIGPKAQAVLLPYLIRDHETYCFSPRESEANRLAALHAERKTPLSCGNRPGSHAAKRGRRLPRKRAGERYSADSYRRAIHTACDKAFLHPELGKLKRTELTPDQLIELKQWQSQHRWSPNRLRHTAATEIRKQFGLEAAQVILGHSTAAITEIYAERDLSKGIEVARKIG